jgi:S-adenosylmethionine:tRNA ribosyltransferase-isomerase
MTDLDAYDYQLPDHLIAQHPVANRSDARMLVVDRAEGEIHHRHVRDLPDILLPGDALVLNDTQVVNARLVGKRSETGGRWEGLFIETNEQGIWRVLSKTRGKLRAGERITLLTPNHQPDVELILGTKQEDGSWLVKPDTGDPQPWAILERVGRVPLPPYIRKGQMTEDDLQTYQTVYARTPGAVAAPTAGLHFTDSLLGKVIERGADIHRLTLHVGLGTFRPIAVERLDEHEMHSEWAEILPDTVDALNERRVQGGRIVAVGTTCVRTLETAARHGDLRPFSGHTDLFIRPPYQFKAVDALMTNFHLPKTTLLVLVRTFGGDDLIRQAYEEAIREEYRFYSYGDSMLIL